MSGGDIVTVAWNPADKDWKLDLSDGNLTATMADNGPGGVRATEGKSSGKWYWEIIVGAVNTTCIGIGTSGASLAAHIGTDAYGYGYKNSDGYKWYNNSGVSYGDTFTQADVISVALDLDNGKIWFGKNGVWQASGNPAAGTNEAFSGISGTYFPMVSIYQTNRAVTANFGASAFSHSIPSGFTAYEGVAEETVYHNLNTIIAADFITDFSDLLTEIQTREISLTDLLSDIRAGNKTLLDLNTEAEAKAQSLTDLFSDIRARDYRFHNLNTAIEAVRSKWWLKTEIKAGCAARWNFNTEWNPGRFLNAVIEAKKPYEFSFKTQTDEDYAATDPEIEFKISGYSFPLRTLFLDYIPVGGSNEYPLELWWARGLTGKGTLKNAKIKTEYIDTQDSGGYEVVTCDWISCKVNGGEYGTVNETPLALGDIPCDSKLDIILKVECRDCSLTRGLAFFKLIIQGDWKEAIYSDSITYQDGSLYHAGLQDDYRSIDFISRLYVVNP